MNTLFKLDWEVSPIDVNYDFGTNQIFKIPLGFLSTGGGSTALVFSVNNKIGNVVLDYSDVGAEPLGSVQTLRTEVNNQINTLSDQKADLSYVMSADSAILGQVNLKANKTYVDSQDQALATSIADKANKVYVDQQDGLLQEAIDLKADAQSVNQALSTKADLVNGVVPASQLPSFVDDVIEFSTRSAFPATGESGKIYVATDTNTTYRWTGSTYAPIGDGGVALGETSATAYRGDRGKIAYDHSQSQGNPHNTTTTEIPEGSNLYFTEPRVRQSPLTGFVNVSGGAVTNTDTVLTAFGKLQDQLNNINQFSEIKVLSTVLSGLFPVNVAVTSTDNVITAFGKLQGQLNNFSNNFPTAVRNTVLTGLSTSNTAISASDTVLQAFGKLQGQIDNIEARVRATPLTGLTIPSTASPITSSDTVIVALGKLQKTASDAATGLVWVHHSQVGSFVTPANWNMTYTNLYFARYGGLLWMKGKLLPTVTVSSGVAFFTITDNNYKVKTIGANSPNSKILFSQQGQTSILMMYHNSNGIISDATTAATYNQTLISLTGLTSGNVFTIHTTGVEELAIP